MITKIGRYIVENNFDSSDEINALECQQDEKNILSLKWAWSQNIEIKFVVIFDLPADDCRKLEELLRDNESFIIITKDIDKYFSKTISKDDGRIYKLFPGKFGSENDIILINQSKNNISDIIYKKIRIEYKITYTKLMFSEYKKATIEISCPAEFDFSLALYYSITGKALRYPLNGLSKNSFLYIAQNEKVSINILEAYQNRLELSSKKD